MTRREFAILAETLGQAYKKDNFLATTSEQEVWYKMLNDLPYEALSVAVQKWITTEKWSPSIAELRSGAAEIINEPISGCEEAWAMVREIARDFSPYDIDRTQARLDALDDITRKCVKLTDIRSIAYSENIGIERAHFVKAYERLANEKKTENQTARSVRTAIEAMQPKPKAIQTEEPMRIPVREEPPQREMTSFDNELRERFM